MRKFRIFLSLIIAMSLGSCGGGATQAIVQPQTSPDEISPPAEPIAATQVSTAEPTDIPTLTPTALPTAIPLLEGNCANILQPLVEGRFARYRVTNPFGEYFFNTQISDHQIDRTETMLIHFTDETTGFTKDDKVACESGSIYNYPSYIINMMFAGQVNAYIDTTHVEGNTYPSYTTLLENGWEYQWELVLQTEDGTKITSDLMPGYFIIGKASDVKEYYELTREMGMVTTPLGDFEAFKVNHEIRFMGTIPVTITDSQAGTMLFTLEEWYAPNIGLVKAEVVKLTLGSSGQSMEVPLRGILELIETSG